MSNDKCPVCSMPVRIVRRENGAADHYEPITEWELDLPPQDEAIAALLRKERDGKKTVAMVGMATTSSGLAPYNETGVEIWSMNEAHAAKWITRADRWFQIHDTFRRKVASRNIIGHYEWLKENKWNIPIYMRSVYEEIPNSIAYPIKKICDEFLSNIHRGNKKIKYFTSSLAYMLPMAILEGYQRIELYGFEMSEDTEYAQQKACAEFWIGLAVGKGIEIYMPEGCQLMNSSLYGGAGIGWEQWQ